MPHLLFNFSSFIHDFRYEKKKNFRTGLRYHDLFKFSKYQMAISMLVLQCALPKISMVALAKNIWKV